MAASGIEGLREKWDAITPRERGLVVLLGVAFVVVVIGLVGFRIDDGLDRISKKNADMRYALQELKSYRANESRMEASSAAQQVQIGTKPLKLDDYLFGIADEVGITIPKVDRPNETKKGKFMERSTKISLRGLNIEQVKDLLQKIETRSKAVVVTDLHIRRHFRKNDQLNVQLTVATYYRRAADKKKSKKSDKKGS